MAHSPDHRSLVASTTRIENFSDAVIAIIVTILVLDLKVPVLADTSFHGVLLGIESVLPHLISFAMSFLTVSVFWVNHHHFYHELDRADGSLLWYNNGLLFFLSLVPFTTSFLSHYPMTRGVVMLYCFVLFLAALSFSMMIRYALCSDDIITHDVTDAERHASYRRSWVGTGLYAFATAAALFTVWIPIVVMLIVPLYYLRPRLLHDHVGH